MSTDMRRCSSQCLSIGMTTETVQLDTERPQLVHQPLQAEDLAVGIGMVITSRTDSSSAATTTIDSSTVEASAHTTHTGLLGAGTSAATATACRDRVGACTTTAASLVACSATHALQPLTRSQPCAQAHRVPEAPATTGAAAAEAQHRTWWQRPRTDVSGNSSHRSSRCHLTRDMLIFHCMCQRLTSLSHTLLTCSFSALNQHLLSHSSSSSVVSTDMSRRCSHSSLRPTPGLPVFHRFALPPQQ